MTRLLARAEPPPVALLVLIAAAIAFTIAGVDHARLFHRGYEHVNVVGPLFLLNAIGTLVVVAFLAADLIGLFVLGVLAISIGSIVSILISHSSSFFGFAEGGWDGSAKIIIITEIVAAVLVVVAVPLGALRREVTA